MTHNATPHRLCAGTSWCICNGQAVFLDLTRDRYFCLADALDRSFRRWSAGAPLAAAELDQLITTGVLEPGGGGGTAAAVHPPAVRDLASEHPHRRALPDVAAAIALQLCARRALGRMPLANIVSGLEARRHGESDRQDEARLRRVAGAFVASAALLRAHDQCLPRAIAARRLCDRLGQAAALIFGVRINPFAAHSWVQSDDAVIVGDLETVRLYTPILVIA